ncbi:hypothetical protein [Rubritalea sp.]|uniref:hypothetical protein n=1 Tax=Rubritalea sp. TaxID=2109375 RepID=UPI003EF0FDE4
MNTLRLYAFIALATIACSCSKTENPNDAYGVQSKVYNYFDSPQKIVSRSGAEFEVHGWLIQEEGRSNEQVSLALRLLCKWLPDTPVEKQVYTTANVLVDGYRVSGSGLTHANNAGIAEDEEAGIQVFILVQPYMPVKWDKVEIQFQGATPTTLVIKNI